MTDLTIDCTDCGRRTDAEDMGTIPVAMINSEETLNDFWVRGAFCTECGSIQAMNISDEEREEAEDKFFDLMQEHGLMTEEERSAVENGSGP